MTPWAYVALFTLGILLWPLCLLEELPGIWSAAPSFLNLALFIFAAVYCSTKNCSYSHGLKIVSASQMTGCMNITMFILPPVLLYVYLASVIISLIGLWKGRAWSQERWERLILGFYNKLRSKHSLS